MATNPTSADRLRQAATGQQMARKEPTSFPKMLEAYKPQIAMALPKHLSADRMLRVALTCFRQNPKLADCDPASVFASVIVGAQLGLEPGVLGQGYLVPYKTKKGMLCQFIPGWQGLVDLVNRAGRACVWTGAVYKGDEFEYEYGSSPMIHHKPSADGDGEGDPANLLYVYAVGKVKGAEFPIIEVWSNLKVRRHRDRYNKVGDSHYSFENFEQYGRKVALLQVIKYLPKSIEMSNAISVGFGADAGHVINIKEAIDGAFLPPPAETTETVETVDKETGEITKFAPSQEAAIARLKSTASLEELKSTWESVRDLYADANASIPIDVEATHNDRREALTQAEIKSRN